jgi:serine protease Do
MKLSLPRFQKINIPKFWRSKIFIIVCIIVIACLLGFSAGIFSSSYYYGQVKNFLSKIKIELPQQPQIIEKEKIIEKEYIPQTSQEEAVISVVKEYSPAVVSIIITKDMPIFEEYYINPFGSESPFGFQIPQFRQEGTQKQEVGGGTGFVVSADGLILTNKHVVLDEEADYTVLTNDGREFPAKVLAIDPVQDLAIIKIDLQSEVDQGGQIIKNPLSSVKLGDSDSLQIGQTVIAIGNSLGEFRNTVSTGVISGLGRTITASGGGLVETIEDVIQTDAAINQGNSGGPLLNLKGEVIGINTATVSGAQSIGFAIPINKAKKDIEQVLTQGKITYPFLGVYYTSITSELKEKYNLPVDYGAWIGRGNDGKPSDKVTLSNSPAESVGLQIDDIILEFNAEKITADNPLSKIIEKYSPGDKITLKILRNGQEKFFQLTLGERNE